MKFGVDFRLQQANNYQREVPSGQFNFAAGLTQNPQSPVGTGSSFATFLFGSVSSASLIRYGGESEKAYSTSFFFQDDWKMSRKLTVNLGLRHDYQQWPRERNNGTSNFAIKGGNAQTGAVTTLYDGKLPGGYSPMKKQGAIVLGSGGDCCKPDGGANDSAGTFYEGAIVAGYPTDATDAAIQTNIVAAGYGATSTKP